MIDVNLGGQQPLPHGASPPLRQSLPPNRLGKNPERKGSPPRALPAHHASRQRTFDAKGPTLPTDKDQCGAWARHHGWVGGWHLASRFQPSLALYGFLAWSLLHSLRSRQALNLIFALAPFAWWALVVAGSHAKAEAERDRAGMVALPVPAELPDTIVFEGKASFPRAADIRKHFGFRYAIYVRSAGKRSCAPTELRSARPARQQAGAGGGVPERCMVFRAKEVTK
jgi:hypothetical protein